MSKFKVGDKVKWKEDSKSYAQFTEGRNPEEILTVSSFYTDGIVQFEEFKGGAFDYRFELAEEEEAPQTSNEKPPFVSFFTSVIVAKNKDVSDIGEMLYDENTTKISLEDEGGGAFLIVEQDYNGAIQQIRLDIDEVETVFSAIKQLVNQMEGK